MPLLSWLRAAVRGARPPLRARAATPTKTQLLLEVLEDRRVPAIIRPRRLSHELWANTTFTVDEATVAAHIAAADAVDAGVGTSGTGGFGDLINLHEAFTATSYTGTGYSVVVIDTGIDYTHPDLGGAWGVRVIAGWDFVNDDANPMDDNGHGTHVAGIIGSSDAVYGGVAPSVNLIALKVLDANGSGTFGDVELALQWVVAHQSQYNIVAVNLSLGTGNYSYNPYAFLDDEFQALNNQGVFIAAAAGNSYYSYGSKQGLGFPAISPLTVSVGAVWAGNFGQVNWQSGAIDYTTAADRITSFTQRSAGLDIFAPGALITSTYIGGGFATMAGTSMATPVIAGAAALIHQALDAAGQPGNAYQAYILGLMKSTGDTIIDGDNENDNVVNTGLSYKRLDLAAALAAIAPTTDNSPPVLSPISNKTMTAGQPLTVTLSASDADGDPILFTARVVGGGSGGDAQAYQLDQQLGLNFTGNYYFNQWGRNEKWMQAADYQWYCILPNGELRRWAGSMTATLGSAYLIATLGTQFYNDPSLLWNAQPPASVPATVTVSGNQLTIQTPSTYTGTFTVEVTASDGEATSTRSFSVTAAAPTATKPMRPGRPRR